MGFKTIRTGTPDAKPSTLFIGLTPVGTIVENDETGTQWECVQSWHGKDWVRVDDRVGVTDDA